MSVITVEALGLNTIDTSVIVADSKADNAFKELGREINLTESIGANNRVYAIGGLEAQGVGEGEKKLVSGSASAVNVGTNKIQVSIAESEEFYTSKPALAEAAYERMPSAINRKEANIIAGLSTVPTEWVNYGTFANPAIAKVEVGLGADASVDLDEAIGTVKDGIVNGIAISSAMLSYMKRQRLDSGVRVFDVTGDYKSGTIDGIPYRVFQSSSPVAFIGNWDNYVHGTAEFKSPLTNETFRIITAGNEETVDGVTINLNAENVIAVRYEQFTASMVVDTASFVKLVPTPVTPGE